MAHRKNGVRVYETAESFKQTLSKEERFKEILLVCLKAMGPKTRKALLREMSQLGYLVESAEIRGRCLQELIDTGRVRTDLVDSIEYLSPDEQAVGRRMLNRVHILAPFDPIVRDRTRFEHLWGWTYRFEAYTPKAKRKLGYYAMPVLWREHLIGWANADVRDGHLTVDFGYAHRKPDEAELEKAAKLEIARLAQFLDLEEDRWTARL